MPETLTTHTRAGLFTTADVPVPLAGVSVVADIVNLCARVTVTQRFVNREATPIEAVYLFPLDEGAAVCGFEALIDGTLVVGESMEREAAFAKYDDAMQEGHGAYLLDEERPDVFQASVGNLPPGKEALLKITYVSELGVQDGALRFVVPTTISPRYAPAVDRVGVGRSDEQTLNPPREWRVPYGLNLTVNLAMSGAIGRIESPSHPIAMAVTDGRTTVTLAAEEVALDRDFVLTVAAAGLDAPCAWIEKDQHRRDRRRGELRAGAAGRSTSGGGDLRRRRIGVDAGLVDRAGAQRAAALPPLDDPRLPLQHRQLRLELRGAVPREPCLRRVQPCGGGQVRVGHEARTAAARRSSRRSRACSRRRPCPSCRGRWWC